MPDMPETHPHGLIKSSTLLRQGRGLSAPEACSIEPGQPVDRIGPIPDNIGPVA